MKVYYLLLCLIPFLLINGQKKTNDSLAKIILQNNSFQENHYHKRYLLIGSFSNGNNKLAKVKTEKGWGFINKSGKEIIPAVLMMFKITNTALQVFTKSKVPIKNL